MDFGQSFDELITASLRCLGENENAFQEELYRKQHGLMKSASIDEFLHSYRPQITHVQNFLASDGEPFPIVDFETMSNTKEHDISSYAIQTVSSGQPTGKAQNLSNNPGNIGITLKQSTSTVRKRSGVRLSSEIKLERRREQNREAQRRRREKLMLRL